MSAYLIQSLLILTLFYGVYRIFLRKMTFFSNNRYFLLTGMLLALLIPLLPLDFSTVRTEYIYVNAETLALSQSLAGNVSNSTLSPVSWSLSKVFMVLYLAGVFIGSIFLLIRLFKVLQILGNGRKSKENGLSLIYTEKEISPFSFFNQIVINPRMHSEDDLDYILVHETIHARQFHQADLMLSEVIRILFWFYPPAYAYGKYVKNNLEYLTDSRSLQKGLDRRGYQLLLVNVSRYSLNENLVNNFSKKLIKERIKMINANQTAIGHRRIYIPLMLLLGLLCMGVGVSAQSEGEKIETKIIVKEAESPKTVTDSKISSNPMESEMRMEYTFDETAGPDEDYDFMRAVLPIGKDSDSIDLKNVSEIILENVNGNEIWVVKYKDGLKIDTLYTKGPNSPNDRFESYRELFGSVPAIDFEELKNRPLIGIDVQKLFEENGKKSYEYQQLLLEYQQRILELQEKGILKKSEDFPQQIRPHWKGSVFKMDKEEFESIAPFFKELSDSVRIHADTLKSKRIKVKEYKTGKKYKYSVSPSIIMRDSEAVSEGKRPIIIKDGKELTGEELMNLQSSEGITVVRQSWEEFKNSDSAKKNDGLIIVLPKPE